MVLATGQGTKMAGCQGTGDDLGVSSSRWRKTQARRQADDGWSVDLAWAESREHRRATDWTGKEKKCTVDVDQPNVNYEKPTAKLEDVRCLDSSRIAGTIWRKSSRCQWMNSSIEDRKSTRLNSI